MRDKERQRAYDKGGMKTKRKFKEVPDRIYCYLCDGVIVEFSTPEAELRYSQSGLCEKCQRRVAKAVEKEGI